jgi:hypothetical protein
VNPAVSVVLLDPQVGFVDMQAVEHVVESRTPTFIPWVERRVLVGDMV